MKHPRIIQGFVVFWALFRLLAVLLLVTGEYGISGDPGNSLTLIWFAVPGIGPAAVMLSGSRNEALSRGPLRTVSLIVRVDLLLGLGVTAMGILSLLLPAQEASMDGSALTDFLGRVAFPAFACLVNIFLTLILGIMSRNAEE